ncbi:hypothetical protein, partial [Rugosimonospora africana]|uniref:hypothetical protein n=1 Tax=Rugosimonospora africana TaxID=556532 RepID=UPI0019411DA1
MDQPDIIEFGVTPSRKRRWGWAAAIVLVLPIGLTLAGTRHAYDSHNVRASITEPPQRPLVGVFGSGYMTYGDQLSFSLHLRNLSPDQVHLKQPAVSPTPGTHVLSVGFETDHDPDSTYLAFVLPAGGTVQLVIQHTVDCTAVRKPWPYLGNIAVRQVTDSGSSTSIQLSTT